VGTARPFALPDTRADPLRNVDHFFFIDVDELESGTNVHSTSSNTTLSASSPYRISGRSANNGLQDELKKDFGEMPGPQKIKLKDYAVMNVAPSVVPTYLPGVRVYT